MEREMAELKLVLHVDQADHWPAAFGNLNNLTRDYPDAEIRVAANGAGIYAFVGQSDLREKFDQFAANGVTFQVCRNALKEHHVEPTALPDFANVVPAGVVALAEAQRDGFAYIKP
jgi:intracellular sulfur oxidation DsrE/DsrF family protein